MDILWLRQTDMTTILKTLPADSWTVTDRVFVRGSDAPWLCCKSHISSSPC